MRAMPEPGEVAGRSPTPGGSLPRPDGREPSRRGAAARSARPHPQAASPRRDAHPMAATRAILPGRPPRAGHSLAAQRSPSRSYVLAALRALHLDSDLPRQDPAAIGRTGKLWDRRPESAGQTAGQTQASSTASSSSVQMISHYPRARRLPQPPGRRPRKLLKRS